MNTTALILAAGRGKRLGALTENKPKVMLEVGGDPLIKHAIAFAQAAGADEFIVVGGYKVDLLREYLNNIMPQIKVLETDYAFQTLDGIKTALPYISNTNLFICNSDYIKGRNVAAAIKAKQDGVCVYASTQINNAHEDEMKIKADKKGTIVSVGKKLKDFTGIYTGDFYCAAEYLSAFKQAVQKASEKYNPLEAVTEHTFLEFDDIVCRPRMVDVGLADWFEIDTPEELTAARQAFNSSDYI